MPDTLPVSPTAGSAPAPTPPSDPVGAPPPAPAPVASEPAATSGDAPPSGTPATPSPEPTADQAFDALMKESAEAQPQPPIAAQPPPAAPTEEPKAQDPPPASEPPPAQEDPEAIDPSPAEVEAKAVPLKKLTRALDRRREAIKEAEEAKAALVKEQQLADAFLNSLNAAGVTTPKLAPFLQSLARARTDPQAQAMLLDTLGIQLPAPQAPAVDQAKLMAALESYDVDAIKSHLASAGILRGPQQAPPQAPPAPVQPAPTQPPAPRPVTADPAFNVLKETVATMGQVLKAQYGEAEARRLAGLIDATAKAEIDKLDALGVEVPITAAAKIWRDAQASVVQREAAARAPAAPVVPPPKPSPASASPPQSIRPGTPPLPRARTADEEMELLIRSGANH